MTEEFDLSAEFISGESCKLFTVLLSPKRPRGLVVFVPPLAEEMHKSRRIVALQSRQLATQGYRVCIMDLPGCGDSSGEFADATWDLWMSEARYLASRLIEVHELPLTLWGLRLGGLLACDLASEMPNVERLLLWQPALNGEQHIDEFLRFELAGQALKGSRRYDRSDLWQRFRERQSLLVAGYELSSTLALQIAGVRLADLNPGARVIWLDTGTAGIAAPPGVDNVLSRWRQIGVRVDWKCVPGQPFWRRVDAQESSELIAATLDSLA